jgi:hypothetical protein
MKNAILKNIKNHAKIVDFVRRITKKMKKYTIKVNNKYLKGFEANESYCRSGRVIGNTGLHNESEYDAELQDEPKLFDSTTCKGYLSTLIEIIRWNGLKTSKIEIEVKEQ